MDRDWTASFSIRFRNGSCIIILDRKYNIANSSCHFGSYGSIWTGPSPKKYYMDRIWTGPSPKNIIWTRSFGHIIFFWWRTGPYTAIWPSVPRTICYLFVLSAFLLSISGLLIVEIKIYTWHQIEVWWYTRGSEAVMRKHRQYNEVKMTTRTTHKTGVNSGDQVYDKLNNVGISCAYSPGVFSPV